MEADVARMMMKLARQRTGCSNRHCLICFNPRMIGHDSSNQRARERSAWRREQHRDERSEELEANLYDFADDSDWALLIGA